MKPRLRLVKSAPVELEAQPTFTWIPLWKDRDAATMVCAWALFLILASPARVMDFDVAIRATIGHSLWSQGTVFVDKGTSVDPGLVWNGDKGTSFYGIGQSLAFIPFDMIGSVLASGATSPTTAGLLAQIPIAFLYVPMMGALWLYALWCFLQAWGLSRKDSAFAAMAYFVAGPALYYSAQSAQEEALVATLGLAALTAAKLGADVSFSDRRTLFLCSLCAGLAVLVRMNAIFFLMPIFGLIWDAYRRDPKAVVANLPLVKWVLAGAAFPALLQLSFATWRFGSPLALGYDEARNLGIGVFWTSLQWDIAFGFLFGLGKGIFVIAPALALAFWGGKRAFEGHRGFGFAVLAAFIVSCVFHGHIENNPDGSECWSVRYLMHLTTLLVLPAWFGFQRARAHEPWKAVAYSMLAIGMFFAGLSLMAPNSLEYTQNVTEGKPQKTLLLSWSEGQLARRATNVSLKLSGEPIDGSSGEPGTHLSNTMTTMTAQYMPNIWPWVLAKKFPQHALWAWLAWFGCLCLSTQLFWQLKQRGTTKGPRIRAVK